MPTQDFAHLQAEAEGGNAAAQLKLARAYESGAGSHRTINLPHSGIEERQNKAAQKLKTRWVRRVL
jgi:TPR repeat protein